MRALQREGSERDTTLLSSREGSDQLERGHSLSSERGQSMVSRMLSYPRGYVQ